LDKMPVDKMPFEKNALETKCHAPLQNLTEIHKILRHYLSGCRNCQLIIGFLGPTL
jgi:hypothetical protein